MAVHSETRGQADYLGQATLVVAGAEFAVEVELRGFIQPLDGVFRWYGRTRPNDEVRAAVGDRMTVGSLRTDYGEASVKIGEFDMWQRYRLLGTGRPPFPVVTNPEAV